MEILTTHIGYVILKIVCVLQSHGFELTTNLQMATMF